MLIGGIQRMTLLDYPGKVAATIFTVGCDFRCSFCHNPELVLGQTAPNLISEKEIWEFLNSRERLIDGICLTGGEPTKQHDLFDFLTKVKKIGLAVKLDTNGSRPEIVRKLLSEKLVDYWAMDIKAVWRKYSKVTQSDIDPSLVQESAAMIMASGAPHEFRSTVLPALHSLSDLLDLARQVKGADKFYFQLFRSAAKLVDPDFAGAKTYFKKDLAPIIKEIKDWFKIDCGIR